MEQHKFSFVTMCFAAKDGAYDPLFPGQLPLAGAVRASTAVGKYVDTQLAGTHSSGNALKDDEL
ncbi:MAG: hypothetical protein J0I91_19990 [Candidatus Accumulibacter sp.]|nr:hypothetical protein [Accumulibacter sp.]